MQKVTNMAKGIVTKFGMSSLGNRVFEINQEGFSKNYSDEKDKLIDFEVCEFAETDVPADAAGVMMINPEYGERLGEISALEETYKRIGDFMKKNCGGYYGYVFTGNMELAKKIGLKAKRRIEFYNSTIDCRLLEYELYSGTRRTDKEND